MPIRQQLLALLMAGTSVVAQAEDEALLTYQTLSPAFALELAKAVQAACRKDGYQVAVAVVDRSGIALAMLRDRYAGPHTPDTATRKAWTTVSFRSDTQTLVEMTQAGKPASGVRNVTHALMVGGGIPVEVAGSLVGAVGVSGAPSGAQDDACARTGLAAVQDQLIF